MIPEPLGDRCYQRIMPVKIDWVLPLLETTTFSDTGGPNAWIARPSWLTQLYDSLALDGTMVFALARKLPPYQGLPPHTDLWGNVPNTGRRFHVPLVTDPRVVMRWPNDHEEVHLEAGWLWEVDYKRLHEVVNLSPTARIHAHFNVVN